MGNCYTQPQKCSSEHDAVFFREFLNGDNGEAFRRCCEKGHLEMAKWLWQISLDIKSPIDIHVNSDYIFRITCSTFENLDVVKWLWQISLDMNSPIDINAQKECAFRWCCTFNNINTAKWLWQKSLDINSLINVHEYEVKNILNYVHSREYLEMERWLCEIYLEYQIEIIDGIARYSKVKMINYDDILQHKNDFEKLKEIFVHKIITKNHCCLICRNENAIVIDIGCKDEFDHYFCVECFCGWYKNNINKCIACFRHFDLGSCKIHISTNMYRLICCQTRILAL